MLLNPSMENLITEQVLVQAWKKTSNYIRYHNWFSDTLELDLVTANLPAFISRIQKKIETGTWESDPIRFVPAPKSHEWHVDPQTQSWKPSRGGKQVSLRPLAHVSLRDQVVATAIMMCLADRVETRQGDPRETISPAPNKAKVISYGNRLFCDRDEKAGVLRHRWGSSKLYRKYFEDYQTFLAKSGVAAEHLTENVHVVSTDIRQFYDHVKPAVLHQKMRSFATDEEELEFCRFAEKVLRWKWNEKDHKQLEDCGVPMFGEICLPQGLVSAGFFANIVLQDFDSALKSIHGKDIDDTITVHDVVRYVDDIRAVITSKKNTEDAKASVFKVFQNILQETAPGLRLAEEKTQIASLDGDGLPLLRQSKKMRRIQTAISGGFDIAGGEEIISAVQSLVRAQERFSESNRNDATAPFGPQPDIRDDTVSRFAAGRFRTTYKSLRPLLDNVEASVSSEDIQGATTFASREMSQQDLDEEAQAFAMSLIDKWISDPSNVRLLRIGLDIWPDSEVLEKVLSFLRPYTSGHHKRRANRVATYCLSEIFRAAATETGFVPDDEQLSNGLDITKYRKTIRIEAERIALLGSAVAAPWYLKQQAMLFLMAFSPETLPIQRAGTVPETKHYRQMLLFLRGQDKSESIAEFSDYAVVARRSFLNKSQAMEVIKLSLDDRRLKAIRQRDPSFASDLAGDTVQGPPQLFLDAEGMVPLQQIVLQGKAVNKLRNEIGVLSFAAAFLKYRITKGGDRVIPHSSIFVKGAEKNSHFIVDEIDASNSLGKTDEGIYEPPIWCDDTDIWRFQLGYLLRFILSAQIDFTEPVRQTSWREDKDLYRPTRSHWWQRHYGFYNGHDAFGDDWLPISGKTEALLFGLLAWPGCYTAKPVWRSNIEQALEYIEGLMREALDCIGPATNLLMLKLQAPNVKLCLINRPLRACVVQSIVPNPKDGDFSKNDITLSNKPIRLRHRNHLASALAAVRKMLALRETHKPNDNRLDWLILPELAVHPDDIQTHLVPFARQHQTIILAGLTYDEVVDGEPLVNSAIWIVPIRTSSRGLQVFVRRQGKKYLSPMETGFELAGLVQGFRPAQWVIGYEWSKQEDALPLWLTGSVCYDATDIRLAADLTDVSDVFAIPALNVDVGTFDQMALALHYHMYQLVVVANNGTFGGSNAYSPWKEQYFKQVFHSHGQPQASISFFEIDDIESYKNRRSLGKQERSSGKKTPGPTWKYPPAGK